MPRPRCKRREAALAKLAAFKDAQPHDPVPASLLTYVDDLGVRRYTVSGHDTRKSSQRASERYSAFRTRARRNEIRLQLALNAAKLICFEWDIVEDRVQRFDAEKLDLSPAHGPFNSFEAVLDAVHHDDRERFRIDIEEALADPEGRFESEIRVINSDGSTAWYSERGQVERDPEGRPMRLIGVAVDVTAQKRAMPASRQRKSELT
jgi:PAS domain-containing protein